MSTHYEYNSFKKLFKVALDIYWFLTNLKILYQALSLIYAQCPATLKSDLEGPLPTSLYVAELYFFVAVHKFSIWSDRSYH